MKAHQRLIREKRAEATPRAAMETLEGSSVQRISLDAARGVILEYEWLGTMPSVPVAAYGLLTPEGELAGVVVFGHGSGIASKHICGKENAPVTICLERGACVHWAHPHAGSHLISAACKMANKDFGWRVFYAYSDYQAGEIGTLYQACNWTYLGVAPGRSGKTRSEFVRPDGKVVTSRVVRRMQRATNFDWREAGWSRRSRNEKGKYVHFVGDRRELKALRAALRYPTVPYPKRQLPPLW